MFASKVKHCNLSNVYRLFTNPLRTVTTIQRLNNRCLLRVSGPEVDYFLQGLITNDIRHLETSGCMYTTLLNSKGRVVYDSIIYKSTVADTRLIECDKEVLDSLHRHLKLYKMKKKIELAEHTEDGLWVVYDEESQLNGTEFKINDKIFFFKDPRIPKLGYRILAESSIQFKDINECISGDTVCDTNDGYKLLRYSLGVPEGSQDMPPGAIMPLEANCDYLHGVSFHKGCYIGQELTARTHHTGVLRRRFMPLFFENELFSAIPYDTPVYSSNSSVKSIGKIKGTYKKFGIALLKISEALDAPHLVVEDHKGNTIKPDWWPIEAPKELASVVKK